MATSIAQVKAGQFDYYSILNSTSYHLEGCLLPPEFHGGLASVLGMEKTVTHEAFRNLFRGYSPDGKQPLTQKQQYKNVHRGCNKIRQKRPGWDMTFSAPKPVSVLYAVAPPDIAQEILQAQLAAVKKALDYLEEAAAFTRRGQGGSIRESVRIIAALSTHGTSRAGDAQIHTHSFLCNLGTTHDGHIGTLMSKPLYEHKLVADSVYLATLATELQHNLGLRCSYGHYRFDIEGVPKSLCDHFSKRRKQIEKLIQERDVTSPKEIDRIVIHSRQPKKNVPSIEQLRPQWLKEAERFGFTPESVSRLIQPQPDRNPEPQFNTAFTTAKNTLTSQATYFDEKDLLHETLNASIGLGIDTVFVQKNVASRINRDSDIVRIEQPHCRYRYATRGTIALMSRLEHIVRNMRRNRSFIIPVQQVDASLEKFGQFRSPLLEELKFHAAQILRAAKKQETWQFHRGILTRFSQFCLDERQKYIIRQLVQRRGGILFSNQLRTGEKEFVLRIAREIWQNAGYQVIGAARTKARSEFLAKITHIDMMTHKMLELKMHPTLGFQTRHHTRQFIRAAQHRQTYPMQPLRIDSATILLVDDAERYSAPQLARLIKDVDAQGGKVVFLSNAYSRNRLNDQPVLELLNRMVGSMEYQPERQKALVRDINNNHHQQQEYQPHL